MKKMELDEALQILKENNVRVINETTSVSAPTFIMGSLGVEAIEKFMEYVKDDVQNKVVDVAEGNEFIKRIDKALEHCPDDFEERLGEAIFKVLGVDPYADMTMQQRSDSPYAD